MLERLFNWKLDSRDSGRISSRNDFYRSVGDYGDSFFFNNDL